MSSIGRAITTTDNGVHSTHNEAALHDFEDFTFKDTQG